MLFHADERHQAECDLRDFFMFFMREAVLERRLFFEKLFLLAPQSMQLADMSIQQDPVSVRPC